MSTQIPALQPDNLRTATHFNDHMREWYDFLDTRINAYIKKEMLAVACSKGCGTCCHIKLDVNAHEILYLVHYVQSKLSPEMLHRVINDLRASAEAIAPLSARDHFLGRYKCGFLQDKCCAIHPARPAMCRKFNSTSLEKCRQVFSPDSSDLSQRPEDKDLDDIASDMINNFDDGIKRAGYDSTLYEINQAVLLALESGGCLERWLAGKKILPDRVKAKQFSTETCERIKKRRDELLALSITKK